MNSAVSIRTALRRANCPFPPAAPTSVQALKEWTSAAASRLILRHLDGANSVLGRIETSALKGGNCRIHVRGYGQ